MNAQAAARAVDGVRPPRRRLRAPSRAERRNLAVGLLFISPWLVGFVCFYLYPALASLYYSFTDFRILQDPSLSASTTTAALVADPFFWKSLTNTLYLAVVGVPLAIVRPSASPSCSTPGDARDRDLPHDLLPAGRGPLGRGGDPVDLAAQPPYGLVNELLGASGSKGQVVLRPCLGQAGIILMTVWAAGDVVIIYLGALQGVSATLYEAAEVDGAGPAAKLRHVTIPMISPAILFNLITGAIGGLPVLHPGLRRVRGHRRAGLRSGRRDPEFAAVLRPQPVQQRLSLLPDRLRLGAGLVPAVLILATTLVLLRASRGRVYYEGER